MSVIGVALSVCLLLMILLCWLMSLCSLIALARFLKGVSLDINCLCVLCNLLKLVTVMLY